MASSAKVAIVTGSNKGIGYATVKKLCKEFSGIVYLTSRDANKGLAAVAKLEAEGLKPHFHQLDVTSAESIEALKLYISEKYGGVDILINNAGIEYQLRETSPNTEQATHTINTNFTGVVSMCRAFLPLVRPHGRIVNVSSAIGHISILKTSLQEKFQDPNLTEAQLTDLMDQFVKNVADGSYTEKGWPDKIPGFDTAYTLSKVAVTTFTRVLGREIKKLNKEDVIVNACCPGWCKTDMTDSNAPGTPDDGAEMVAYLAFLPPGSPSGEFWMKKKVAPWHSYTLEELHKMVTAIVSMK